MSKRLFDIVFSVIAIIVTSPIMLLMMVLIPLASPGPAVYRARRIGKDGRMFTMHKFRSMHMDQGDNPSRITAFRDSRVFPLGAFMRRTKIDELPQFFDVLAGKMSVVGPRPEDEKFVRENYTQVHMETLDALPGLTCPGSVFSYSHGEEMLDGEDAEKLYVERLMDTKLAMDIVYVRNISVIYDLRLILRTIYVLGARLMGKKNFAEPPELRIARESGLTMVKATSEPVSGRVTVAAGKS